MVDVIPESVSPDGLRLRAFVVRGKIDDGGSCARHLELAADLIEKLQSENLKLHKAMDDKRDKKPDSHGDGGEYERLMERLVAGHTVTKADALDFKNFLADYNDEIENDTRVYFQAQHDVLIEVGGEELLNAWRVNDEHMISQATAKALARFHEINAKRKKESN